METDMTQMIVGHEGLSASGFRKRMRQRSFRQASSRPRVVRGQTSEYGFRAPCLPIRLEQYGYREDVVHPTWQMVSRWLLALLARPFNGRTIHYVLICIFYTKHSTTSRFLGRCSSTTLLQSPSYYRILSALSKLYEPRENTKK